MISNSCCDIIVLSDNKDPVAVQTDGRRNKVTLNTGKNYSLKVRNKLPHNAPFVLHTRINVMVLDAVVIGPGEDISCPIPKLSEWLQRQMTEVETERINFDIFPLRCWTMQEGMEVPYEDTATFGSRRMHPDDLLDPEPSWSSYFTVPSDVSVAYSSPTRPLHSTGINISFLRTPTEADHLRDKIASMDTALKQLTTRFLASQSIEKGLRKELEKEQKARLKLENNFEASEKHRVKAEGQLSQTKVKLESVTNRMAEMTVPLKKDIQRLETEMETLRAKNAELQSISTKLTKLDGCFNNILEERQQLLSRMGTLDSEVKSEKRTPLKRKITGADLDEPENRIVRQRVTDWPSTLRVEESSKENHDPLSQAQASPVQQSSTSAPRTKPLLLSSTLTNKLPEKPPPPTRTPKTTQPLFLPSPTSSNSKSGKKGTPLPHERNAYPYRLPTTTQTSDPRRSRK